VAYNKQAGDELHRRILNGDRTASAELFETYLDPLVRHLRFKWPREPEEQLRDLAVDCLAGYIERPERFDPSQASLQTWLNLDAHRDLQNAYQKAKRSPRFFSIDVSGEGPRRKEIPEMGVEDYHASDEETESLLQLLKETFIDPTDRAVVGLLLADHDNDDLYVEVLGLRGLSKAERDAAINRAKARVRRRAQRARKKT